MDTNQDQSGLFIHDLIAYYIFDFNFDAHITVIGAQNDTSTSKLYLVSFQYNNLEFELWINRSEFINYSSITYKLNQHDNIEKKKKRES